MSLSIGVSLAAQTVAIDHEDSSRVLYDGHAGLGADLVGRPKADDTVLSAFEHGELHRPFVIAPLWDSKAEPPSDHAAARAHRPDLRASDVASHGDSLSEMGEMESLRLQMAMDRLSKMMSTLSNVLQKIEETQAGITQNIK